MYGSAALSYYGRVILLSNRAIPELDVKRVGHGRLGTTTGSPARRYHFDVDDDATYPGNDRYFTVAHSNRNKNNTIQPDRRDQITFR